MEKVMNKKSVLLMLLIFTITAFTSYFEIFYAPDRYIMDKLYQVPSKTNQNIRIIAIDEKTLDAYGPLNTWSRKKCAELVNLLNENEDTKPAVIGFDIMFIGETGTEDDTQFAAACAGSDNIVTAVNIVDETVLETDQTGKLEENRLHISMIEKPYVSLLQSTNIGFANTYKKIRKKR